MGKILVVGIKDSSYHKIKYEFKNEYNLSDFNQIIYLLETLDQLGAPIDKAIEKYLLKGKKVFPI